MRGRSIRTRAGITIALAASVEVIDNATFRTSFVYAGTPSFSDPPEPDRPQ